MRVYIKQVLMSSLQSYTKKCLINMNKIKNGQDSETNEPSESTQKPQEPTILADFVGACLHLTQLILSVASCTSNTLRINYRILSNFVFIIRVAAILYISLLRNVPVL